MDFFLGVQLHFTINLKYIFADMEETDSVFKTKQPVLIIEVEDEE